MRKSFGGILAGAAAVALVLGASVSGAYAATYNGSIVCSGTRSSALVTNSVGSGSGSFQLYQVPANSTSFSFSGGYKVTPSPYQSSTYSVAANFSSVPTGTCI
jgi:hypothetical protein